MKERPILFSGAMVRAILEGRKTVTRRVVNGSQIPAYDRNAPVEGMRWSAVGQRHPRYGFCVFGSTQAECAQELGLHGVCPYGVVGDRLWVRETFNRSNPGGADGVYYYRADGHFPAAMGGNRFYGNEAWKPSIHMPRVASRILLEITAVRVERLQDGDGETAFESRYLAEGINRIHHGDGDYYYHAFQSEPDPGNWVDPIDAWRELWVAVNGADSWAANPWVWVVEFKRVEASDV